MSRLFRVKPIWGHTTNDDPPPLPETTTTDPTPCLTLVVQNRVVVLYCLFGRSTDRPLFNLWYFSTLLSGPFLP